MTQPRRTVRTVALGAGALVIVLAVVLALSLGQDRSDEKGIPQGQVAPTFALSKLDGGSVKLSDLRGKAVIINFWNEWCAPCRQEHPALKAFYEQHKKEPDFAMIGITRDPDSVKRVRDWVTENGVDWTIVLDPTKRTAIDYGTTGQPETYAISPRGVIVDKYLSAISVSRLETMLATARGAR